MRSNRVFRRLSFSALFRPSYRNAMINRRSAYCCNCNSNVVHVRLFQRKWAYLLDKVTLSCLGWFGFGPWQCADCSFRGMTLIPTQSDAPTIGEDGSCDNPDPLQPVGNFIRTQHSLAHACSDASRFSPKYRIGIVEKLIEGKSTVSRTCTELGISELEIQRWIRDYLQIQVDKVTEAAAGRIIQSEPAGLEKPEPIDWTADEMAGMVIESTAVRKPR